MTINLTKEEKAQIISSHIRNLKYTKYNLEIDILKENSRNNPSEAAINGLDEQMDEVDGQISALESELARVNALTE
jgi:hypothetical protein